MKMKSFKPGWKTGVLMLLGIPLVIKAADITGDYLKVTYFGLFGSSWTGSYSVNVAIGDYNTWESWVQNSLTVGSNLKAYDSNSLLVGTWNQDTYYNELFVIGRGWGQYDKHNSLEVYTNGSALTVRAVEPQGDIQTGNHSGYKGLANLGQLKHAATVAHDDLANLLPGGAGYRLGDSFAPPPSQPSQHWYDEHRNVVVVGEVKAIAAPLYGVLNHYAPEWVTDTQFDENGMAGWSYAVPWDPNTPVDDNYIVATVAHLKGALEMHFAHTEDGDQIPDLLELVLFGDTATADDSGDFDGDGVSNGTEVSDGTKLWLKDTDGDGIDDDADQQPLTRNSTGGGPPIAQLHVWTPSE